MLYSQELACLPPNDQVFFIYDKTPAHRNANNSGANSELKPLPAYSPFLNLVKQAISCLKEAIKTYLSSLDQQRSMGDRDEARRQGLPLEKLRKILLLRATSYKEHECYHATKMHAMVQPHTNLSSIEDA